VTQWFNQWGFWAVLIAGFSPVPYKIFTISAGALGLAFIPFLLASLIGRGARFFLVAWCLATFGPAIEHKLMHYIERIGWAIVIILIITIGIYQWWV
jgi:membrane protein DedA with SNARE-associated domain